MIVLPAEHECDLPQVLRLAPGDGVAFSPDLHEIGFLYQGLSPDCLQHLIEKKPRAWRKLRHDIRMVNCSTRLLPKRLRRMIPAGGNKWLSVTNSKRFAKPRN